jgi:Carboxypeptidase regulatory-like domain
MRNKSFRYTFLCCLLAICVAFIPTPVIPQDRCGGIFGRATSTDGWLIPNANIRITEKATKKSINVATDGNGEYSICLSAGKYDLIATALGYKHAERKSIEVAASGKNVIDFVMKHDRKNVANLDRP